MPNRELEQSVAIPDFRAAGRPRLSPGAAQGIAPYAVVQQQTSAQSGTTQPGDTSESSQGLMSMAAKMIMTIQTSADGVRSDSASEQQTMKSLFQTRIEEVHALKARLECTEHGLRDLAIVAECEHGAAQKILRDSREFHSYMEYQARGCGQEETQAPMLIENYEDIDKLTP
eukprot:2814176-Amphidinium_carterae.2